MVVQLFRGKAVRVLHVLNLGAGVQSTTIALMAEKGLIRWCDLDKGTDAKRHKMWAEDTTPVTFHAAVFADTGDEPRAVYLHLAWLVEQVSYPVLIRSANPRRNAIFSRLTSMDKPTNKGRLRRILGWIARMKQGSLGDDLIRGQYSLGGRFAAIPAFTTDTEGVLGGKTKRQCTKEYKTEIITRTIRLEICGLQPRQRIKRDIELHQYLGLSYDEPTRIFGRGDKPGVKVRVEAGRFANKLAHFPLFDMYLTREICQAWLAKQTIPHDVPRSACVYCPFKSNKEWRRLRDEDPAGWARAVEVDAGLRTTGAVANRQMEQMMYVHKSCLPLDRAPIDQPDEIPRQTDFNFAAEECEGMCGL